MGNPNKHNWVVRYYRIPRLGFDENGERTLHRSQINDRTFRTLRMARERSARHLPTQSTEIIRIAGRINERQRRVVELDVWHGCDEDYR